MANASSKKIASTNKQAINNLTNGLLIVNAVYFLWRVVYHWSSFTFTQFLLYATTGGLTFLFYRILVSSGTPSYAADGSLIGSGDDLNSEGLTAYMFDIIYVTWFVHITTAFISNKFWMVYLVIPGYAAYKLIPMALSYFGRGKGQSSEASVETKSKRQAKLEKRANKGGQVKYAR
ncbi:hypothetical protein [Parasitella parasitica]|uniref:DUF788-domain-containing protein n=1 Tax=Parasitella parasitica TaxID=35722 RepID=A0A0B7N536_9FUNG|nr:hypothetical protein [Parasitella parasitica]